MSSLEDSARLKVLKQLARTEGAKADAALANEARKIASILESETGFDRLAEQLTHLGMIAFRVSDLTLATCQKFLKRLGDLELTLDHGGSWAHQYETNERLISDTLDVLSGIRYFKITEVLLIFLAQANSHHADIRKKASECLRALAEYNIDVVFSGKGRGGLGIAPQIRILEYIESLQDPDRLKHFASLVEMSGLLLSPNVTGTSWDYRTVTWQSGALMPTPAVLNLRQRILGQLESLYSLVPDVGSKLSVIGKMMEATRMPNRGTPGDEVVAMVSDNTVRVLNFLERILPTQPLPIMQRIEHDAYWRFYHAPSQAVQEAALKIRSLLENFPEYAIYRDLIGYESIFHHWEEAQEGATDFEAVERHRSARAIEYANSVDDETWARWRSRIIEFARTESSDLATFPKFYEFLDVFAKRRPDLALALLREDLNDIRDFVIPLMRGVWSTRQQPELRSLIWEWIEIGDLLGAITKLFIENDEIDRNILQCVLEKQTAATDIFGLLQFVSVALSNYEREPDLVQVLMLPAIEAISAQKSSSWVHELWYRPELAAILKGVSNVERETFVEFLLDAPRIDFHEEEILAPIAEGDPSRIIGFFGQRIEREMAGAGDSEYEAIPYKFHKLHKVLGKFPEIAVAIVRSWFGLERSLFRNSGAKFLSNIFPEFPRHFSQELRAMVGVGSSDDIEFVLSILQSYDGQEFLNEVCRDIVAVLPVDDQLLSEIRAVIYTTGATVGEYGMAESYEAKAASLATWLDDQSDKVRHFAESSITALGDAAVKERARAGEEIELRKHRFGGNSENSSNDEQVSGR